MRIVLALFLLLFQAGQPPDRWECDGGSEPLPKEGLARVKAKELRERVVSCAVPRLPGNFDAQGQILVEVQVDEEGNVRCARAVSGHPIIRRAALDAAQKWRFEPLKVEGQAKPYRSFLYLVVHWDASEAGKQCPAEKRRA